jgi:diguanylate cyclase (GGDEF)-like protein
MKATENRKLLKFQLDLTKAMLGTHNLDTLLFAILRGIQSHLEFNRVFLFLTDPGHRELRASFAVGSTKSENSDIPEADLHQILSNLEDELAHPETKKITDRMASLVVPLSEIDPNIKQGDQDLPIQALIAHCCQRQTPFFSNTIKALYPPLDYRAGEPITFSKLALVPLLLGTKILGVILADKQMNSRPVDPTDVDALAYFGNLAAMAIDRRRLGQKQEEMAAIDGLTGVFNRQHYESRLAYEISKAKRIGRSLSLMVFDLDFFHACNDRHGHEMGDQVLKDLTALFRRCVRSEDLIARSGGDEFVVLLTGGATSDEAYTVAEKLRCSVAGCSLAKRPAKEITVSGGICHLDADQLQMTRLLRSTYEALQKAKQQGRNCIVRSQP